MYMFILIQNQNLKHNYFYSIQNFVIVLPKGEKDSFKFIQKYFFLIFITMVKSDVFLTILHILIGQLNCTSFSI